MNNQLKKFIGILAAVFVLSVAYYGSYLPLKKSQAFINSMREISGILRSVQNAEGLRAAMPDIKERLSSVFAMPSSIGQEELVRNAANLFLEILNSTNDPALISEIMDFVTLHFQPILDRGSGMSFGQDLYIVGAMNELAFIKTQQARFLQAAKENYLHGYQLGPKRPQPLHGLFDIYRIEGNVDKTREIGEQILAQWPDEQRTREALANFLAQMSAQ